MHIAEYIDQKIKFLGIVLSISCVLILPAVAISLAVLWFLLGSIH